MTGKIEKHTKYKPIFFFFGSIGIKLHLNNVVRRNITWRKRKETQKLTTKTV